MDDDGTEFTNLDDYAIANKYELFCLFYCDITSAGGADAQHILISIIKMYNQATDVAK